MDWTALWVSVRLASLTTAILFLAGVPLAYWLATSRLRGKFLIEALDYAAADIAAHGPGVLPADGQCARQPLGASA